MEKNFNGYFGVYGTCGGDTIGVCLKVENNKITDCFAEKPERFGYGGLAVEINFIDEVTDVNNNIEKIVGEDFKDLIFEGTLENKFLGRNLSDDYDGEFEFIIRFRNSSEDYFMRRKQKAFPTPEEMKAHDQKVADILQAKENKNTLGKADTLSRIAGIKNERTGGQ